MCPERPPRRSRSRTKAPLPDPHRAGLDAVAPWFDMDADRNAFDRMLLAFATHADGAGFRRAHLLLWSADTERLEGRLSWLAPLDAPPLAAWLATASRQASISTDVEATRRLRGWMVGPAALDEVPRRAWETDAPTFGAAGEHSDGPWAAAGWLGAVPLSGSRRYGLLIGEWEGVQDGQHAALESLRRAVRAALVARERANGARARARLQDGVRAIGACGAEARNLAEVGQPIAEAAAEATGARGALLWRVGEGGDLALAGVSGPSGLRERAARGLVALARAAAERARVLRHALDQPDSRVPDDLAVVLGAAVAMPLTIEGHSLGVLAVYGRDLAHPTEPVDFDRDDLDALEVVAHAAAQVLARARGDERARALELGVREMRVRAERAEALARLGEAAAHAAQEARNPIASIGAFARRVHRNLAEDDPNREYLEVVVRESERLERVMVELAPRGEAEIGPLRPSDLNALVQSVLQRVSEPLVRRRVRLLKKLTPGLPELLLDAERVHRVVHNVLQHALEEVAAGGRIRVETRRAQGHVVIEIAHDGPRISGELIEQLFVPFQLAGAGGCPMGLGVAQRIVQQHGGEVRVRSEGEWGAIVSLTLPVRGNEDRRGPGADRRAPRVDRRARRTAI